MSNQLLEYIEIKDFKCFKDFNAKGFKRVNLIGGKNNVGKTAFMEACFSNITSEDVASMFTSIVEINFMREKLESVNEEYTVEQLTNFILNTKNYELKTNKNNTKFCVINEDGKLEYQFNINDKIVLINANNFSHRHIKFTNIKFIDNFGFTNHDLKEVYIAVQKKDKENTLYKYINEFDTNVLNFKIMGGERPECKVISSNKYQSINEFGDGLKHYISIICSLYACENGYLFIDEIDNGIHYTQLDRLWEIILTISKEQNVQVFATTHSKECIESYARVSKKLEEEQTIDKDDVCFVELGKNKDNKLDSIVYNYDMIQSEIKQNHEIRGW